MILTIIYEKNKTISRTIVATNQQLAEYKGTKHS